MKILVQKASGKATEGIIPHGETSNPWVLQRDSAFWNNTLDSNDPRNPVPHILHFRYLNDRLLQQVEMYYIFPTPRLIILPGELFQAMIIARLIGSYHLLPRTKSSGVLNKCGKSVRKTEGLTHWDIIDYIEMILYKYFERKQWLKNLETEGVPLQYVIKSICNSEHCFMDLANNNVMHDLFRGGNRDSTKDIISQLGRASDKVDRSEVERPDDFEKLRKAFQGELRSKSIPAVWRKATEKDFSNMCDCCR